MDRCDKNKNSPTEVQGQYSTKDMRASYIKQSRSNDKKQPMRNLTYEPKNQ